MYTASFAFFEALWEAGVTHCFVNLGSDHPSLIEAMVKGRKEKMGAFPRMITCPNEMVAMSMADGYARLTGKPQCVIVHVDVGTQGLGAAVHNASCGRAPVLIFAGMCPFTIEGELRGSRTETINWIQDVPDQRQIVSQYCRYSAEIRSGKNVKQMVQRALQFSCSAPSGPVYLCGAREVMEEEVSPYELDQAHWSPTEPAALAPSALNVICEALVGAKEPLVITGYSGRNHATVGALVKLADLVKGLRVVENGGGSDLCFPADHRAWIGLRNGADLSIKTADVILVIDCDVPWINTQCRPPKTARIFHIDIDPLKQRMNVFYLAAESRYFADSFTAINQLIDHLSTPEFSQHLNSGEFAQKWEALGSSHQKRLATIASAAVPKPDDSFGTGYLCRLLRSIVPLDTIWAVEAVTNTGFVANNVQASLPGSWIGCGGGGLGWSGGGALGIKMASDYQNGGKGKFIVQVVGDGSFLFSVPSSVYWISQRYQIPILTIILNNGGWAAPKHSVLLVHPKGYASQATDDEMNLSFSPAPDYSGIAKAAAAGNLLAEQVSKASELENVLKRAVESVQNGTTAVIDALVRPYC